MEELRIPYKLDILNHQHKNVWTMLVMMFRTDEYKII